MIQPMTDRAVFETNFHLAPLTSMGTGGVVDRLYRVSSIAQLREAASTILDAGRPPIIFGGGSNLIVSDDGVAGGLIQFSGFADMVHLGNGFVEVGAGADWDEFVEWTVQLGLSGVECLSGIPGGVGAAPVQNIGAYGQDVSQTIRWVDVLDVHTLNTERMTVQACNFGYRTSIFKTCKSARFIVTRVAFQLSTATHSSPQYKELSARVGVSATLRTVRDAVLEIRRGKGMTLDHQLGFGSAGSFFMNPILDGPTHERLLRQTNGKCPHWLEGDGGFKVPAAWLIESCGFKKGFRQGDIGLSPRHALALVNYGNGTSTALLELALTIRAAVSERYNIHLIMEPVLLGRGLERFSILKTEGHP